MLLHEDTSMAKLWLVQEASLILAACASGGLEGSHPAEALGREAVLILTPWGLDPKIFTRHTCVKEVCRV